MFFKDKKYILAFKDGYHSFFSFLFCEIYLTHQKIRKKKINKNTLNLKGSLYLIRLKNVEGEKSTEIYNKKISLKGNYLRKKRQRSRKNNSLFFAKRKIISFVF